MSRVAREHLILDLVRQQPLGSQHALIAALAQRGLAVTQATVSRDIKALGLVKVPSARGYRYAEPGAAIAHAPAAGETLRLALRSFAFDVAPAAALLVLHTKIGGASPVALALDEVHLPGVVGTIAGDDTVLVLLASARHRSRVERALSEMIAG